MNEYCGSTSFARAVFVFLMTPLPSLIVVALIDAMPLEAPERGLEHSTMSCVRGTMACFIYTHCAIEQIRLYSPNLRLEPLTGLGMSFPTAILTSALTLALSFICWPLPFTTILMAGPWLGFMTFFLFRVRGAHMRANPEAIRDVLRFATICGVQASIVMVYAVFVTIFTNLSPSYQPMFALLLPAFKFIQKNVLSRILAGRDDTKPQVVILNVEIFNALFISTCMRDSQSFNTSITLIAIDLLQAGISLLDLYRMINEVKRILDKLGIHSNELISAAELVLANYPATANREPTTNQLTPQVARVFLKKKQVLPTMNVELGGYEIPVPISKSQSLRNASRVSSTFTDIKPSNPRTGLNKISSQEHYRLLKKTLQVVFLTEFMLLIEFTEVLVPVIYGGYLTILYHLPNRRFYPQLANLSDQELWDMVISVLEYGALELASLTLLVLVLNRLVYRHSLKQLAFVLEREFFMVQPKLLLWVTMTMQSTLPHLGADYSFKFASSITATPRHSKTELDTINYVD
ncbi:hypothetical protein PI126_g8268 [Phytophthora idaei]|nr:hypothetical protein PI126_g8268 [Phytophthora idaei]